MREDRGGEDSTYILQIRGTNQRYKLYSRGAD